MFFYMYLYDRSLKDHSAGVWDDLRAHQNAAFNLPDSVPRHAF